MSETDSEKCAGGEIRSRGRLAIARGAADWLCLAAAPTFALMSVLTTVQGSDAHQMACMSMTDASSWSGMGLMYLLMGIFHAAPWVKLAARRS